MKKLIIGVLTAASLASVSLAAALPAFAQPVDQREQHQQQRIDQGVHSGQLTARETRHLERREASIRHEQRVMRAEHNGRLTRHDREVLNHRLNRTSHAVYAKKHNAAVR